MTYAKFMHPENGYEIDKKKVKDAGLVVGNRYVLEDADVGRWSTVVTLQGVPGYFNSVHFIFEDEYGREVNIYNDPKYCRYNLAIKYEF